MQSTATPPPAPREGLWWGVFEVEAGHVWALLISALLLMALLGQRWCGFLSAMIWFGGSNATLQVPVGRRINATVLLIPFKRQFPSPRVSRAPACPE